MKIFLDTAKVDEIRRASDLGMIDGVTTNPTLLMQAGRPLAEAVKEICSLVDGPVSVEVLSHGEEEMVEEARRLASLHDNVVVKVPMSAAGLKVVRRCEEEEIQTNMTLVFSPLQALLAAKAGASFTSIFVGRMDDISAPGMDVVEQIVTIYGNYEFRTEVLVASVRHPIHVLEAAMMGADGVTVPFGVLMQLVEHPLTAQGVERFLRDGKSIPS